VRARHLVVALAIAAYFVTALAWLGGRARRDEGIYPEGSIYETSNHGLSLAFEYLQKRGRAASSRREPLSAAAVPTAATVFRIQPWGSTMLLHADEDEWVSRGGRLVLAVRATYGPLLLEDASETIEKTFPVWPGVQRLAPASSRAFRAGLPAEAVTLFAADGEPVVSRLPRGRGEVVLLAAPEIFDNAHLGTADHLLFLEALTDGRPVFFDEHSHGQAREEGAVDLLLEWGLGPLLVLLGATLLTALWRNRARLGPAEDEHGESRSDAVHLVDSLALLYDRALSDADMLRLYRDGLRRATGARTGLSGRALEDRLEALEGDTTFPQGPMSPAEFRDKLRALVRAYDRMEDHVHTR
jgi:hypothetical protein